MDALLQKYLETFILAGADDVLLLSMFPLKKKDIREFEKKFISRKAPKMQRLALAHKEPDEEMRKLKVYSVILGIDFLLWQLGEKELPLEKEMEYKAFISGKSQYDSLRIQASKLTKDNKTSLLDEIEQITIQMKSAKEFPKIDVNG